MDLFLLLLVTYIWLKWKWTRENHLHLNRNEDILMIYSTSTGKIIKTYFSKSSPILYHQNIKASSLPLRSIKLTSLTLNYVVLMVFNNTIVHRKTIKLRIHWSSKVPKRYKRNPIFGDLHSAKRISTDFDA